MKYEYCGISLGDDIKDIIEKFNMSKIEYEKDLKYLSFKLGKISQKTNLESFLSIPIKIGKVIYIIIFDKNFKLFNELEIWQELTDEIKEKFFYALSIHAKHLATNPKKGFSIKSNWGVMEYAGLYVLSHVLKKDEYRK